MVQARGQTQVASPCRPGHWDQLFFSGPVSLSVPGDNDELLGAYRVRWDRLCVRCQPVSSSS